MKNIFIIISILFTTTIAHAQKMYELFNGYLSPITQTGQILVNVNGVDYNAFGFTAAFNNDLGQYDGSELNSITSDVFIAVTVDGKVYELKLNSFVGGSIVQGTAIDFSNELTALPSGAAAIYVKTPKTNFPASTAGLTDELREAIDNHFKLLIDKISSSCIVRVEQSTAHALSVGDFLTVVEEGVFEETTTSDIPNAVVVDVENQLVFSYAVCGSYDVNDFSVLGKIQWNGISDGEYVHTLVTGEQYRMFEKWGSQITIDGPYAKAINVIADNGLTSYTAPSGKLIQLGGTLNKNTEINGDNAYSIILHNNISNIVSTGSETNVGSALSHYYNNFLLSNTTDLDFSYLSQALSNMNIGSVIDESTTGDYYYQYMDFNGLEKGGLFITSDNSVGLERYIRVFGSRNSDNSIYISNKKESTNEETSIVLNYDKILLKTPNVYGATTTADQYLKLIDPVTGEVEFADIATPATTLPELTDVTITTPVNDQVLKYSNGEWVNGTFTGGTGLSSVIGVNGITTSDNGDNTYNVSLGGTLTSPTTIEGNGNSFTVNSTGSIILQNNLNSFISVEPTLTSIKGNLYQNGGDVHFQDYGDGNKLNANPAYILGVDNGGKIYEYDLANIPSTTVTQSNGLTVTQTGDNYDVKLGGQLTENTLIQGLTNTITLNSSASITLYNGSSSYISVNTLGAQINGNVLQNGGYARFSDYGGATPITGTLAKLTGFDINGQLIAIDPSSVTGASAIEDLTNVSITSLADGQILKYDQASDTWINAADATGSVGGGVTSISAANGLTLSGTAEDPVISLGGTLTNSTTTINANGNGVSLTGASSINLSANNVFISTDAVTGSTATTGQVLKLANSLNGEVEYADDITFANTDLTISSPRNHTMSNSTFTIQGTGSNLINLTIDPALSGLEASDYSQITGKTGLFMDTNIDNVLLYGDLVTSKGTNVFFDYGQGNKTATALSVVHNNGYMLGVADDGTVIEVTDVLSNVELTTPAEGEILTYNSLGKWVNSTLPTIDLSTSNIGDLGNVTISGVKDEQFLQYNSGTSLWENVDFLLGSIPNVNISTPLDGQVLKYDQASNTWINGPDNTGIGTDSEESTTASNGLTLSGTDVKLGGTLSDNTVIYTNGKGLYLGETDNAVGIAISQPNDILRLYGFTLLESYGDGTQLVTGHSTDASPGFSPYTYLLGVNTSGGVKEVPAELNALSDVVISTPATNQALIYNGTDWVNAALPSGSSTLASLTDTDLTGVVSGNVLKYNGTTWIPSNDNSESTTASNGLTKVGFDVRLGGTLSQSTNIELSSHDLSLVSGAAGTGILIQPTSLLTTLFGRQRFSIYGNGNTEAIDLGLTASDYIAGFSTDGTLIEVPISSLGSASTLNDLTDVNAPTPSDGNVLKYNGSTWVAGTDNSEITTASNGLTKVGNNIQLGGALTENNTTIGTGTGNLNFDVNSINFNSVSDIRFESDISQMSFIAPMSVSFNSDVISLSSNNNVTFSVGTDPLNQSVYFFKENYIEFSNYGKGNNEYEDLVGTAFPSGSETNYLLGLASDGTLIEVDKTTLGGSGASTLNELTDVNAPTPSDGNVLKYDNATTSWIPSTDLDAQVMTGINGISANASGKNYQIQLDASVNISQNTVFNHQSLQFGATDLLSEVGFISDGSTNIFTIYGTQEFDDYGLGNKEATDLTKTESNYVAAFATDGTLVEKRFNNTPNPYPSSGGYSGIELPFLETYIASADGTSSFGESGIEITASGYFVLLKQKAFSIKSQTTSTIDFDDTPQRIVKYDLTSASTTTVLTLSGAVSGGIYTIHFINATGKTIDWPSNAYDETGSEKANDTITSAGKMFTMYYDGANYYVK